MADAAAPTWAGKSESPLVEFLRTTVVPALLVVVTPPAVVLLWIACTYEGGSLLALASADGLRTIAERFPRPTLAAAEIIAAFFAFEVLLLVALPGPTIQGPITPSGVRPLYKKNGVFAWAVSHVAFLGVSFGLKWFSPSIVYDHFGELLITLCSSCFVFCWLLYVKGKHWPSTPDAGTSGSLALDYFWGVELHPSIGGVNLKQLFNCRIGMMGWSLTVLSFAARQYQDIGHLSTSMLVSVALQVAYILKFFVWEDGYFSTLDIMHDRFGYYICWGVIAWIPGVYTIHAQYLVKHPIELSWPVAIGIFATGLFAIVANYDADAQRQRVRRTAGKTRVWGKPPSLVRATYRTADGAEHESLLLASGWWGIARHVHYVSELLIAFCWTVPAGFSHFLPWFYFTFLTILLVDRANRDDARCRTKYGKDWEAYCKKVKWRMVPFIY